MSHKKSENKEKTEQTVLQGSQKTGSSTPNGSPAFLEQLKAALVKGNVLFGSRSVMKSLKLKNPKIVFVASNCPETVRSDIGSHAKISGATVENFAGTAKQLGIVCGKPFAIASLAVLPEQKKK